MLQRISTVIEIPKNPRVSHLPIHEIGLRFESTTVGPHVPNCEIFAGRSSCREPIADVK